MARLTRGEPPPGELRPHEPQTGTGPIDRRLLRRAGATRNYLIAGVVVGTLSALLIVIQAWVLAAELAEIFAGRGLPSLAALALLAGVFTARAALSWTSSWLAHRTSAAVKSQLRGDIMAARLARPAQSTVSTAALITIVTKGLDALDGYFSKYLPQLLLAVTVPLVAGVAILTADLTSAIVVALTVPLIPIFMALIGWATQARVDKRWRVQGKLAGHFADLVAGLPTLQVFGRAKAQVKGLRTIEASHRRETMGTLRISFLSALVLELLSTLSVAVVAVGIGLRVVNGTLDLGTALFVLMLAPEVYLPIRQVGVHFHDSADGVAAADQAFGLIDAAAGAEPSLVETASPTTALELRSVSVDYPGPEQPIVALSDFSLTVEHGEVVALIGPSGCGKSTALAVAMGFVTPATGATAVPGVADGSWEAWRGTVAWVSQTPGLIGGSIDDNVAMGAEQAAPIERRRALDRVGGTELDLDQPVGEGGIGLSAGERRRVGLARAWLRMTHGGGKILLLDEPTAGLDADAELTVIEALRARGATAVVVTHRPAVIAAADRVVTMAARAVAGGDRT